MSHFTKTRKYKDYDDKSTRTTSSIASMKNIAKESKNISKEFTTVNTQLKNLKESHSYLSDSEDEDEASNFQMAKINFVKATSNLHSWTRN